MSTSSANGTTIVTGPEVIQSSDFYVHAGILHPLVVGSIAVIVLFFYLRLGSNRSVAPITVFDWIINVALGSTLAGIVNGNSLARGVIALFTMLAFQFTTSFMSSHYKQRFQWIFHSPPIVIAFRGGFLDKIMKKHRICQSDIYGAMRQHCILHIEQIEVVIIEANGSLSLFTQECVEQCAWDAEALMQVPAYKALCEKAGPLRSKNKGVTEKDGRGSHRSLTPQTSESEPWGDIALQNERPPRVSIKNVHAVLPV